MMEKSNYIGYLWYSDQNEPEVYLGEKEILPVLDTSVNPFIVEGHLFSPEMSISVSIRFVDGKYVIKSIPITEEDLKNAVGYESNRVEGKTMYFAQKWEERPDDNCLGMSVFVPAGMVFVGFEK